MIDLTKFAYCESVHATSISPWHIRELSAAVGLKLGGGVDTASLCGRVQPRGAGPGGFGGWDLVVAVELDDPFGRVCVQCLKVLQQRAVAP